MLVSSCEYLANNDPTLEITLKQLSNQDGNMTVTLASNLAVKPDAFFRHEMPYIVILSLFYLTLYIFSKIYREKIMGLSSFLPFSLPMNLSILIICMSPFLVLGTLVNSLFLLERNCCEQAFCRRSELGLHCLDRSRSPKRVSSLNRINIELFEVSEYCIHLL